MISTSVSVITSSEGYVSGKGFITSQYDGSIHFLWRLRDHLAFRKILEVNTVPACFLMIVREQHGCRFRHSVSVPRQLSDERK